MSILNVEHLTHGFGDRAIFNDVSFRRKVHIYEHCYRENDAR